MSHIIRSLSSPFASYSSLYSNSISQEELFRVQADIIRQKAENESCIIVGRCSDYILREHPRRLNIFVRADYDDRLRFVMEREQIDKEKASQLIEHIDAIRSDYHNFYAETNWGDARAYDVCINSSVLGIEATARFLTDMAREALHI